MGIPILFRGAGGGQTFTYTASGGVTVSGAAPVAVVKVPSISGGITTGGAAETSFSTSYVYVASGGATVGGAATTSFVSASKSVRRRRWPRYGQEQPLARFWVYVASGARHPRGAALTRFVAARIPEPWAPEEDDDLSDLLVGMLS